VDEGVGQRHLADERVRHRRVAVDGVREQRLADRAAVDGGLDVAEAGVVPPHESDLDEPASRRDLGVHHLERVTRTARQGLLAEHGLARGQAGEHLLGVQVPGGRDQDGVDAGVPDDGGPRVGRLGPYLPGEGGGPVARDVEDRGDGRPHHLAR
jgi:hypothetical protein